MRICLAGSAGGHLSELLQVQQSWQGHEIFWVTTSNVVRDKLREYGKVYVCSECNRQHLIRVIAAFLQCVGVILRERPDVVISTGAAPGCIACFLGKLIGAKIIWIDSIANVERISLSGRMIRYISDLFLVQWPKLARQYKNVEYVGAVV